MHHKPQTFLQWVIATADRVASGFDREEFEKYNEAKEGTVTGKNHYTARQLTLFEQIRLHSENKQLYEYRYKLKPLSPDNLFPVKAQGYETDDNEKPTPIDTSEIQLKQIKADLFDSVAQKTAEAIADNKYSNKPTQLRRFYDEITLWESKVNQHPEKFDEYLPFIRMMNAKAAYALGRKLVDDNFVKLINDGLRQVEDAKSLRNFKLFMEAFMGFYKEKRPKD